MKMKKYSLLFVLLLGTLFFAFGCSCGLEQAVSNEEALNVLKSIEMDENMKVTTTTETVVNNQRSTSIQEEYYYENKYYHVSEGEDISTKTWYGYIDDILYAFYYTKSAEEIETKNSSRIETSQLESIKKQPTSIIDSIITDEGTLVEGYALNATRMGDKYNIEISVNEEEESSVYTITILNNRITKLEQINGVESNSIKITYVYEYDINDFELPSLNEYPLKVNN